jgi:threonine/homoserine efflux transporter RhtA
MSEAAHWQGGTRLAFVAHQSLMLHAQPYSVTRAPTVLMAGRREPDDDLLFSAVIWMGKFISRPTPGFPTLSIGYPLALVSVFLVIPLPTALLLSTFFAGYAYLGRQVTEEDESKLDFAAFLAATVSAGLLSPFGLSNGNGEGIVDFVALLVLGVAVSSLIAASPSEDEKLLDKWDDKFDDEFKR